MEGLAEDNDEELKKLTGVKTLFGEKGFTSMERTTARPTAEVNGIGGGYQGQGTKTVLPSKAFAKLTFRLVPKQDPAKILDQVEAHLRKHCPPGVELEISRGHSGDWYLVDPHSKDGDAAQRALETTFGSKPALDSRRRQHSDRADFQEGAGRGNAAAGPGLARLPRAFAEREFPGREPHRGHSPESRSAARTGEVLTRQSSAARMRPASPSASAISSAATGASKCRRQLCRHCASQKSKWRAPRPSGACAASRRPW